MRRYSKLASRIAVTLRMPAAVMAFLTGSLSCSNIDCPLNNVARLVCGFYDTRTNGTFTLTDTITVTTAGTDSILFNYGHNISSLKLPISYSHETDTLIVRIMGAEASSRDTIFISHTNEPHFESVDCGMLMFHTIKDVKWASGGAAGLPRIDSVTVASPKVNYDASENLRIYFALP